MTTNTNNKVHHETLETLPGSELSATFEQEFLNWQGNQPQRDDVTWFGFRY